MSIRVYERRQKEKKLGSTMKKEPELDIRSLWVPDTPVKPTPTRRHRVYVKRRSKNNSGISFLERISAKEAQEQVSESLLNNSGEVVVAAEKGQDPSGTTCTSLDRVPESSPATNFGDKNAESGVAVGADDKDRNSDWVECDYSDSDGLTDLLKPIDFYADCRSNYYGDSVKSFHESVLEQATEKKPAFLADTKVAVRAGSLASSEGPNEYQVPSEATLKVGADSPSAIHESSRVTKGVDDQDSASQVDKSKRSYLTNETNSPESCAHQSDKQGFTEKLHRAECAQPTQPAGIFVTSTPLPKQNTKKRQVRDEVEENKRLRKKPKRHRPRILDKSKPKRTPKPAAPKHATSKSEKKEKRKYVRKNLSEKADVPEIVTEPGNAEIKPEVTEKCPSEGRPPEVIEIALKWEVEVIVTENTKTPNINHSVVSDHLNLKWSVHRIRTSKYRKRNYSWLGPNIQSKKSRKKRRRKLNFFSLYPFSNNDKIKKKKSLLYLDEKKIRRKKRSLLARRKLIDPWGKIKQNMERRDHIDVSDNIGIPNEIDTGALVHSTSDTLSANQEDGTQSCHKPLEVISNGNRNAEEVFNETVNDITRRLKSLKLIGKSKVGTRRSSFPFLVEATMAPLPSCDLLTNSPRFDSDLFDPASLDGSPRFDSNLFDLASLDAGALYSCQDPHQNVNQHTCAAPLPNIGARSLYFGSLLLSGQALYGIAPPSSGCRALFAQVPPDTRVVVPKGPSTGKRVIAEPSSGPLVTFNPVPPEAKAIVPHQDRTKKKKISGKVDLDNETTRMWNLLTNGEAEEKEDEEKWRSEREMFEGRINSFLSKMDVFLGDRKFRPWKGSVVDSVVGVYLTQNVSDILSSTTYMNLAAKFPVKSTSNGGARGQDNIPFAPTYDQQGNRYFVTDPELDVNQVSEKVEELLIEGANVTSLADIDHGKVVKSGIEESASQGRDREHNCASDSQDLIEEFYRSQSSKPICSMDQECISPAREETTSPTSDTHKGCEFNSERQERCFKDQDCISLTSGVEERIPLTCNLDEGCILSSGSPDAPVDKPASSPDDVVQSQCSCSEEPKPTFDVNITMDKKEENPKVSEGVDYSRTVPRGIKRVNKKKEEKKERDWEAVRKVYSRPISKDQTDSVDWEAVRQADIKELASIIKSRGQNVIIANRIKAFLNRLVEDHKTIDLEWLRHVPPDDAKEYLLSFDGLGLKSVECVRLLSLQNIAFPVDVNVGRIAVRLGWVPLEPLPGDLQFHLLEEYPLMDSIQKFLWPRLCKLDQKKLYELHYHMITFGKVFCQKKQPNCRACPLRAECKHYASQFASQRLSLPAPPEKEYQVPGVLVETHAMLRNDAAVSKPISISILESNTATESESRKDNCEPLIEMPESPQREPDISDIEESDIPDIEDFGIHKCMRDDDEDIPHIKLNEEEFNANVKYFMEKYANNLQDASNASRALVPASMKAAARHEKLKNITRLRTEHSVYEIPDGHQLLEGFWERDEAESLPYLLAIWSPGETPDSCESPQKLCNSEGSQVCGNNRCSHCENIREQELGIVRGTILIPCRTANRGRFPLNGTYFQVNEVFADHETSHVPLLVPRSWIWYLRRRIVYVGTSASSIFKDMESEEVQITFRKGFVCVRGFDRAVGNAVLLSKRFHCSPSKMEKKHTRQKQKINTVKEPMASEASGSMS